MLLFRLGSPRVLAALAAWREFSELRAEHMRCVRRAAQFMINGHFILVFSAWARYWRRRAACRTAAAELTARRRAGHGRLVAPDVGVQQLADFAGHDSPAQHPWRTRTAVFDAWVEYTLETVRGPVTRLFRPCQTAPCPTLVMRLQVAFRAALALQVEQLQQLGGGAADLLRTSCERWFAGERVPYFQAWLEFVSWRRGAPLPLPRRGSRYLPSGHVSLCRS